MYLLYSILLVTWGILLAPFYFYRAWRQRKPVIGLSQRLGRLPESLKFDGRPTIWFHSCSVGETLSLQPLVDALHFRFPELRFVFSTITKTGQFIAKQHFARYGDGNSFYFPIDLASVARRVIEWIQPVMMVIIDTEIWPNVLHQAHRRGTQIVLANGRISAASFRFYRWARPVLRRVFRDYAALMMQSEEDAERITMMGAPWDKIAVTGNIKFDKDLVVKEADEALTRNLEKDLDFAYLQAPLIVAGSTHHGEEQVLLEVLRRIRRTPQLENVRMVLAPRHPERFDAVAQLISRNGFRLWRRTNGTGPPQDADVILLDTVGELAAVYRFATIAFVGGTLLRHGGHSIMEPALHAKPIVIGPSMDNFGSIIREFRMHDGIWQISAGEKDANLQVQQLLDAFEQLLTSPSKRESMGKAAHAILERNRGAAQRTIEKIAAIYQKSKMNMHARVASGQQFV